MTPALQTALSLLAIAAVGWLTAVVTRATTALNQKTEATKAHTAAVTDQTQTIREAHGLPAKAHHKAKQ